MTSSHHALLEDAVPPELEKDFLGKLHYVSESLASFRLDPNDRRRVLFERRPDGTDAADEISARIAEVARKLSASGRRFEDRLILDKRNKPTPFAEDPHPLLEARGELHRFGPGRYGLGPGLAGLLEFFESELHQAGLAMGARPHRFPALIGGGDLDRCHYLRTFPQALSLVSHLREDLRVIQQFSANARWSGRGLEGAQDCLADAENLLASAVCFHCYAWLADTEIEAPRIFTATNKCFRYESGAMIGLERLWDFSMREIVFVGPPSFVTERRQDALDQAVRLLDRWGLAYQVRSATDPFFVDEFSKQASFQNAFDLKWEIQCPLPYNNKQLAVGSSNFHQDFFGRSFDIRGADGTAQSTSCLGFGLERLCLAFLAQHGVDPGNWPDAVAEALPLWGESP